MRLSIPWRLSLRSALAGAASLLLAAAPALAEDSFYPGPRVPAGCPVPQVIPWPGMMPGASSGTGTGSGMGTGTGTDAGLSSSPAAAPSAGAEPSAGEGGLAVGGETYGADPGYIDSAIIRSQFRVRFDAARDDIRPDRAEFFYAKCGCFRGAPAPFTDPKAPGPPLPESRVDYQDISSYLELAATERFSGFIEVPYRFLNPEANANASGISDINAGFKYAVVSDCNRTLTLQFRTYIPTGDAGQGLGTDHVSLEPALLAHQKLTDRLALDAELRDWIPIGGTEFSGNVIRYGIGVSYDVYHCGNLHVDPIVEVVGWSILNGKESVLLGAPIKDSGGETIVNGKAGVRVHFGEHSDIYAGYGHALTGTFWYKDIARLEYRFSF